MQVAERGNPTAGPEVGTTAGRSPRHAIAVGELVRPHSARTDEMVRMNRDRSGGDDGFAEVGEEPTLRARYPGPCATCGQRFVVGEPIASVVLDKTTTYHHGACRYPATALLSQHASEADVGGAGSVGHAPKQDRCATTTKRGKPCSNAPQKGERFCGPRLTQRATRTNSSGSGPHDETA